MSKYTFARITPQDWKDHPVMAARKFLQHLLGMKVGLDEETLALLHELAERELDIQAYEAITHRLEAIWQVMYGAHYMSTGRDTDEPQTAPRPHQPYHSQEPGDSQAIFAAIHRLLWALEASYAYSSHHIVDVKSAPTGIANVDDDPADPERLRRKLS